MDHRAFLEMLGAVEGMTAGQAEKFSAAIEGRGQSDEVCRLIEQHFETDKKCPHCGEKHLQRCGKVSGLQRFLCMSCKKSFNALTGTPLARLHNKEQWLNFARTLTESLSVRAAAKRCNVTKNTSFHWRHRFLESQKNNQDQKLSGVGEIDETFFLESFKGQKKLSRPARKRGGKAKKRGLSKEQIPVLIARDRHGHHIDAVLPDRSTASISAVLKGKFSPDTLLCMDEDAASIRFAKNEKIEFETIVASKGEHVVEGVIHVQNVNAYTRRLKQWMARFNGVATKYLTSYLGWHRMLDMHDPDNLKPENCLTSAIC